MMMDTLSDAMDDTQKSRRHTSNDARKPTPTGIEGDIFAVNNTNVNTNTSPKPSKPDSTVNAPQPPQEMTPQELLAHGMAFFRGLAKTLQSPDDTQKLVDSIVETDTQTGQSHLKIPVPDKDTVGTLLGALGKLFAK
jgi:hypothetical protein